MKQLSTFRRLKPRFRWTRKKKRRSRQLLELDPQKRYALNSRKKSKNWTRCTCESRKWKRLAADTPRERVGSPRSSFIVTSYSRRVPQGTWQSRIGGPVRWNVQPSLHRGSQLQRTGLIGCLDPRYSSRTPFLQIFVHSSRFLFHILLVSISIQFLSRIKTCDWRAVYRSTWCRSRRELSKDY